MNTYVLVHGAWHGAWCWYKVIPFLEKAGNRVIVPDMPCLGRDKTPIDGTTMDDCTTRICDILDAEASPVILAGHSWGGNVITRAAESMPEKIELLVYVTAFLLDGSGPPLQPGHESRLTQNVVMSEDGTSSSVKEEALEEVFYHDCPEEDVTLAKLLLSPHPSAYMAPFSATEERFGTVPRVYIECQQDKALVPSMAKEMYTRLPCREIISMDTSHSPFFAAPEELAHHLLSL